MRSLLVAALLAFSAPALAEEPAPAPVVETPPKGPKANRFGGSFTVAPILMIAIPPELRRVIFELTSEFPLAPKHSLALVVGMGWAVGTTTSTNPFEPPRETRYRATNLGGQYRYYAIGNFDHGLHVALEALLSDVSGRAATSSAVKVAPLLGYKVVAPFGLTFEVQAGGGFVVDTGRVRPLAVVNANLGWSFVFKKAATRPGQP